MILQSNQLGDLGWGWRSVTNAAKKVGAGAYNVAKMPAGMAKRVANATAGVLCDQNGNPRGTDSTSVNYCRAVKLKQEASMRKYLPGAAAMASKASAVRTAYQAPVNTDGFGGFRARLSPCNRARKLWRGADGKATWAFTSTRDVQVRRACGVPASAAEYAEGRGFGTPDANLLAGLAGADQNELAFALAGVTPIDIQGVTTSDALMFVPSLLAVAAGFWMTLRG